MGASTLPPYPPPHPTPPPPIRRRCRSATSRSSMRERNSLRQSGSFERSKRFSLSARPFCRLSRRITPRWHTIHYSLIPIPHPVPIRGRHDRADAHLRCCCALERAKLSTTVLLRTCCMHLLNAFDACTCWSCTYCCKLNARTLHCVRCEAWHVSHAKYLSLG